MDKETNKRLGELIFELAKGNIGALAEIYSVMGRILYAVGNIYLSQKADIEDEIQNLLIKLCEVAHKFKKNAYACAWIIKIYKNSIKNRIRKEKREIDNKAKALESIQLSQENADDSYLENHLFYRDILNGLSGYEQKLLIDRYICKYSIGEIAELYKKPKSTMEYQLTKLEEKVKRL